MELGDIWKEKSVEPDERCDVSDWGEGGSPQIPGDLKEALETSGLRSC